MELRITIDNKKFMFLLALVISISAVGLVLAYGGTQPSIMGHTWGDMECSGCISNANIGDNEVTGTKIADGSITTPDIGSINGSKIVGTVPSATNADKTDGYHASEIANWGGVCNPVWGGCSTCCGGGTAYCNYMGIYVSFRGTAVCLYTASSQGSCGSQTCSDISCCSSITTPYLFTYAGGRYLIESDVMNTYFQYPGMTVKDTQEAYETNMQSAEFLSQDIYKMRLQPEVIGGAIRLQVKELEPEESQFDRVRLVRIVHSRDSMTFSDNYKIYNAKITEIKPLSCTDESNSDCLAQVSSDDMNYLRKDKGQYIIVRFRLDSSPSSNLLAINSWENDFIPPIVSSPYAEGYSGGLSIRISYLNNGAWVKTGNDFHPRALKNTQYGITVDGFADSEGFITLKLEWTGPHIVDKITIANIVEQLMRQEALQLKRAIHSTDGDVTASLLDKDFIYAHTVRGDSIDLEFDAGNIQAGPGEVVDYFFISEGYYHGLRTYLYPQVDTSDSFKAEVNQYIEDLNDYIAANANY